MSNDRDLTCVGDGKELPQVAVDASGGAGQVDEAVALDGDLARDSFHVSK